MKAAGHRVLLLLLALFTVCRFSNGLERTTHVYCPTAKLLFATSLLFSFHFIYFLVYGAVR